MLARLISPMMLLLLATRLCAQAPALDSTPPEATGRIAGIVMEVRAGTPDVIVVVCDYESGMPLTPDLGPVTESKESQGTLALLTAQTGERGRFAFTVPPGEYRLVAQKWTGPFKGVFEVQGTVVQLFGAARVSVPSEQAEQVVLTPPGRGVVQFDQEVDNNETLFFLSTHPPAGDPILGPHAMGSRFLQNVIAFNRMPYGRTTVVGIPAARLHAFFIALDNNPGFASQQVDVAGFARAPRIPFVAGWSDGRHTPPERLAKLGERLADEGVDPRELLGIADLAREKRRQIEAELLADLEREIELPGGAAATVGDLLAVIGYERLRRAVERRRLK